MASEGARPRAPSFIDPPGYARHRREATLLYQIVEQHYTEFVAVREAAGRPLPKYVREEFAAYVAASGTGFCACAARTVTPRSSSRSAASAAAFVPPAALDG